MLFFKLLTVITTVAFGSLYVVASPIAAPATSLSKKDGINSIPQILANVKSAVTPLTKQLGAYRLSIGFPFHWLDHDF